MTEVTLEQLKERLNRENHLVWVFYRGKKRTDELDRQKGVFSLEGNIAWTGHWNKTPSVQYDRVAHWNDQSQVLYLGRRSDKPMRPIGEGRFQIPFEDVEVYHVTQKSEKSLKFQELIPEAARRIQVVTYWPKSAEEYVTAGRPMLKKSSQKKRAPSAEDVDNVASYLDQLGLIDSLCNEVLREVWCRTNAHGRFKSRLVNSWNGKCALTGLENSALLVASHIKPWAACRYNPKDQVNEHNGLLLCAPIDKLFDRGFLSFSNSGETLLHKRSHQRYLKDTELIKFGLQRSNLPKLRNVDEKSYPFLEYHRDNIFHAE